MLAKPLTQSSSAPREYKEGFTEFLSCRIDLSHHPLIPRPETEFWVNEFLTKRLSTPGTDLGGPFQVLDMFAGSGCIGIAVASKCPNATITLADKTSYISTPLPASAKFVQSDLFVNISAKFDFILANPPYVPEGKGAGGIMEHEPAEALYAGIDGLGVIRPFLEQAHEHLSQGGQIWMEFGADQKEAITELLREFNYYQNFDCSFHRDQHGAWRYVVIG